MASEMAAVGPALPCSLPRPPIPATALPWERLRGTGQIDVRCDVLHVPVLPSAEVQTAPQADSPPGRLP